MTAGAEPAGGPRSWLGVSSSLTWPMGMTLFAHTWQPTLHGLAPAWSLHAPVSDKCSSDPVPVCTCDCGLLSHRKLLSSARPEAAGVQLLVYCSELCVQLEWHLRLGAGT